MATPPVMKITPPYTPELLERVQIVIAKHLKSYIHRPRILELGSGWSTLWFASQYFDVLSYEHNQDWFKEVKKALVIEGLTDAYVRYLDPSNFPIELRKLEGTFDLIYVDCIDEQRLPCIIEALPKLTDGGWLVVDDTHWDILQPIWTILGACSYQEFGGMHKRKTGEVCYHQTTIFYK